VGIKGHGVKLSGFFLHEDGIRVRVRVRVRV
jgi:hypothetical protein